MTEQSDAAPLPSLEQLEAHKAHLRERTDALAYLAERGISAEVCERYGIGYDDAAGAFTIPIFDEGALVNVRWWGHAEKTRERFKFRGVKGRNQNRMFPDGVMPGTSTIYLLEGEPDCLAALSLGLNAVTFTSGATATPVTSRLELFKDREVRVVYDADDAGRKGAKKAAKEIRRYTSKVKVLNVCDMGAEEGMDFTDMLKSVRDKSEALARIEQADEAAEYDKAKVENFHVVHDVGFSESIGADYINKIVRLRGTVAGCSERPYSVFLKVTGRCSAMQHDNAKCLACPLSSGGERVADLTPRQLLCQVDVRDQQLQKFYDYALGARCSAWEVVETKADRRSIYHVALSHNVDSAMLDPSEASSDSSMQLRSAWIVTSATGGPRINSTYDLIGMTVTSPLDQANVQVFTSAKLTVNPVEQFTLTDEAKQVIQGFTP